MTLMPCAPSCSRTFSRSAFATTANSLYPILPTISDAKTEKIRKRLRALCECLPLTIGPSLQPFGRRTVASGRRSVLLRSGAPQILSLLPTFSQCFRLKKAVATIAVKCCRHLA